MGFESKEFEIKDLSIKSLELDQVSITLPELKVYSNKGTEILQKAVDKAISDSISRTNLKAYYQKTTSQNGRYTWLNEMYLNMEWGQYGVSKWQPTNARYAHAQDEFTSSNFIFLCFFSTGTLKHNYNKGFPLNERNISGGYSYNLLYFLNESSEDEIAVIECKPKPQNNENYFRGEILVKTRSSNILKIKGEFSDIKTKRKIKIDLNFKEGESGFPVFQNLYVIVESKINRKTNLEKAWLYAIKDIPNLNDNDRTYPAFVMNDIEIFENSRYNEKEWEENLPIRYTAEANKVIEYFGRKKGILGNIK